MIHGRSRIRFQLTLPFSRRFLPYRLVTHPHRLIHQQALWDLVGDEEHGHAAFELIDGFGEVLRGDGVEVGGGFVENEDLRVLEKRARAMASLWR